MRNPTDAMPTVFLSHGAPSLYLEKSPQRHFMENLASSWTKPKAILCISAHWVTSGLRITGAAQPKTLHDFYGFADELYQLRYPAPGDKEIVTSVVASLSQAGIACEIDMLRGYDHGVWSPLLLAYPQADIPVVALSLPENSTATSLYRIGQALQPLKEEGLLILGSGGATHNLGALKPGNNQPMPWAIAFQTWLDSALNQGDLKALLAWRELAPDPNRNHPTPEHLWPLFVSLGAGDFPNQPVHALFHDFFMSSLSLASYRIG